MARVLSSITDVFSSVFLLVRRHADGTYGVLLITAAPSLRNRALPFDALAPGLYKFRWERDDLKEVALLLRGLGCYVFLYEYESLQDWSAPIAGLPSYAGRPEDSPLREVAQALPDCQVYVEVFGGRAPLLMAREPAPVEVFNDYARAAITLFHTLRDPSSFSWFYLISQLVPPTNSFLTSHLFAVWEEQNDRDAVLAAYAWYCYMRDAFPAVELAPAQETLPDTTSDKVMAALRSVDPVLPQLHSRLYRVQIEHNTIEKVLQINDAPHTLFWVDPPFEGIGALDLDGTHILLSYLNTLNGTVALYQDGTVLNPHIRSLMRGDAPWAKWKALRFSHSTVYLKQCTEEA
jgi:hypothetical protein